MMEKKIFIVLIVAWVGAVVAMSFAEDTVFGMFMSAVILCFYGMWINHP